MSNVDPDLQRNSEATRRLGELVAGLDEADLQRSLGGGWTVAFALVHLAFWDARQDVALRGYAQGDPIPSEDETVNASLEAIAGMFDPAAAGAAAVEAAERLDATSSGLADEAALRAARGGAGVHLPPLASPRGTHRPDRSGAPVGDLCETPTSPIRLPLPRGEGGGEGEDSRAPTQRSP